MLMTPNLRKFALSAHVASAVGLLGAIAAFLSLALVGLNSADPRLIRSAYVAMDLVARLVIAPLAGTSLVIGLIEAWGTPWGLVRHNWVLSKFLLTVFATIVFFTKLRLIGYAAQLATEVILPRAELRVAGQQLALHAAGGLIVLLVPAVLSVYKPRGLTLFAFGRRAQRSDWPRAASRRKSSWVHAGSITIRLGLARLIGGVGAIIAAHVIAFHLMGANHFHH